MVYHETIAVRLGEGGISVGTIAPEAFNRGIQALLRFRECIDQHRVTTIKAVATSAIRSAANGDEFISRAKSATGMNVEVIDGEKEAELIYQGVRAAVDLPRSSLIVDIGGGSVEFIICDKNEIFWKKSYPIGAARLMSSFHHTDPISNVEISEIDSYLERILTDLKQQLNIYRPELMIGSAGAFETFAELQGPQFKTSFEKPAQIIDLDKFKEISAILLKSTHAERKEMPEIIPVRRDMIVVATVVTNYVLKISRAKSLKLSSYSLKEGMLFGTGK